MDSITIKDVRQKLNMTQQEFADFLGVRFETVNRWENKRREPSPMALKLLQRAIEQAKGSLKK